MEKNYISLQKVQRRARILISLIDDIVEQQVRAVVKHPAFQDMLTVWSGVHYLTKSCAENITYIRIFDVKMSELTKFMDAESGIDSVISTKILNEQDIPSYSPLSLIITSYSFDLTQKTHVDILEQLALVSSYAFTPFLFDLTFNILGVQEISNLEYFSLADIDKSPLFKKACNLSSIPHSCFLFPIMPKINLPSIQKNSTKHLFLSHLELNKTVLSSGAFGVAAVIMQSFISTRWFLDMMGLPIDDTGKILPYGLIQNLVSQGVFNTKKMNIVFSKANIPFAISEKKEKELCDLGITPLSHIKNTSYVVLFNSQSLRTLYFKRQAIHFKDPSCILPYLLCACRFAAYIKIIGRNKVGEFTNAQEYQAFLNKWILQYVAANPDVKPELKRKFPLLAATIEVRKSHMLKNNYQCTMSLKPHLMSSAIATELVLKTEIDDTIKAS
ncbi:type VI secretion system contractile sheath domain-containing protein [Candidatus Sneabacter namystus]|uniref:Type VI secretion system contractile sheath large subunit n=1 Tax=Candidatus Sneabacter namystus TaxID=2601646 RepID=A0A5C0ULW7_9RICK|nr:type VI secretion system contractile sheath large subunit [Candidatus Sneabacter namystus]QEK39894.1 type VI secretion system contractile sheath large subunit [Candidatus Sneabacter namystus]